MKHGARMEREGVVLEPETAFAQYQAASSFLRGNGYRQDSMRRFVRQTTARAFSECGFGTSIGLGCGGRSYLGKLHFCSPYAITRSDCLARLKDYENTADFMEITHGIILSEEGDQKALCHSTFTDSPRTGAGAVSGAFGEDVLDAFSLLRAWIEQGYAVLEGERISFH